MKTFTCAIIVVVCIIILYCARYRDNRYHYGNQYNSRQEGFYGNTFVPTQLFGDEEWWKERSWWRPNMTTNECGKMCGLECKYRCMKGCELQHLS